MPDSAGALPAPALGHKSTRHGEIFYFAADRYMGRALELYGEHSWTEVEFLCSLLSPGDTVIDAGAHIGTLALPMAAKVGPDGHVYAFEPQPAVAALLTKNTEINAAGAITVFGCALGARKDRASVPTLDFSQVNNFGGVSLEAGTSVPVGTIDELALTDCRLIKVDVEGMEADVLEGARATIARLQPLLYVENDRPEKAPALVELIRGLGYSMRWHVPYYFNPDNLAGRKENIFPGEASLNMICVPKGQQLEQAKGLRMVTGPYDSPRSRRTSGDVRPANGWAGVARFGGIGDNLIAASAVGALKRKGLKVEVITSADCAWQVFEHNPNIDKLSIKTKSEMAAGGLDWQKWFKGRSDEYDVFAHLSHSCEATLALFPASTQFWWPEHVRRKLCNVNYLELVHDIAGCGYDFGPLFYPSEEERAHAIETKGKVGPRCIAWVLSGTRIDKVHPHTPGVIARILKEVGAPVVMLGKPGKNFEDAKVIQEHVRKTNGSLAGLHLAVSSSPPEDGSNPVVDWPIRRGLSFAHASDLVIGPDTGVMWAVAFEPMPKIMLLGHASPENITKHWINTTTLHADQNNVPCWPCHRLHDEPSTCTPNKENNGTACLTDISVDRIVRAVAEIWGR